MILDTETHRTCGHCNELKTVSEFFKDGTTRDGTPKYRRDCKDCYRVTRIRSKRAKQKPKLKGRSRK